MNKCLFALGSFSGALAVAIGAFGAHALSPVLEQTGRSGTFETGNKYHFYHSIAIILAGIAHKHFSIKLTAISGYLFAAGIMLFSFSLYALSLTGINELGIITPFGGFCFIAGWTLLGTGAFKRSNEEGVSRYE